MHLNRTAWEVLHNELADQLIDIQGYVAQLERAGPQNRNREALVMALKDLEIYAKCVVSSHRATKPDHSLGVSTTSEMRL
jgi:hypothetical protein